MLEINPECLPFIKFVITFIAVGAFVLVMALNPIKTDDYHNYDYRKEGKYK